MRPTLPTAALFCLTLAACVPATPIGGPIPPPMPEPMPPGHSGACGAGDLMGYLGHPVTDLPASGPWGTLRVIRPGMMVTMDYSESRLNARVDARDRIIDLTCG